MKNAYKTKNDKFSRPGIIDARAWYRAGARRLRNTVIGHLLVFCQWCFHAEG